MFNNKRYLTAGVQATIPPELQLFMWSCIDRMPAPKDYLQVFRLHEVGVNESVAVIKYFSIKNPQKRLLICF